MDTVVRRLLLLPRIDSAHCDRSCTSMHGRVSNTDHKACPSCKHDDRPSSVPEQQWACMCTLLWAVCSSNNLNCCGQQCSISHVIRFGSCDPMTAIPFSSFPLLTFVHSVRIRENHTSVTSFYSFVGLYNASLLTRSSVSAGSIVLSSNASTCMCARHVDTSSAEPDQSEA